jgi:hypothetical protein
MLKPPTNMAVNESQHRQVNNFIITTTIFLLSIGLFVLKALKISPIK